jgi:hypothetical protein
MRFRKEQVQNEASLNSRLNRYLKHKKAFYIWGSFQSVEMALDLSGNHTYISTSRVRVKYTYKCTCRFINPNLQVSYTLILLIVPGNSFLIHCV